MTFKPILKAFFCLLCGLALSLSLARPVYAATLTVDTTADDAIANGNCTLREAIEAANTNTTVDGCVDPGDAGQDTIIFSPAVSGTISLGSTLPLISEPLLIDGAEQDVTISGNNTVRVFDANAPLSLQGLTVTQGRANEGGGIRSMAVLTLIDVQVISNTSASAGGGVMAYATLALTNTDFISNTALGNGGGAASLTMITINGGRFENNTATTAGGGGVFSALLVLTNTDFINNTANSAGGGAFAAGKAAVNGSRFENNRAYDGGGLAGLVTLDLTNTDFISNTANNDGGGVAATQKISVNGGNFQRNRAINGNGGGLSFIGSSSVTINRSTFISNSAGASDGGALSIDGGDLTLTNTDFIDNIANSDGGAIMIDTAGCSLMVNGGLFERNVATLADDTFGGGAILSFCPTTISNAIFQNNSVDSVVSGGVGGINSKGGAVRLIGAPAAIDNSAFTHNMADQGGGIDTDNTLRLTYSSILSNSASANSGGIYLAASASAAIENTTLAYNQVPIGDSGAIETFGSLSMTNTTIYSNSAFGDSGGIGVGGGTTRLVNVTITNNTARTGQAALSSAGTLHLINTLIANNSPADCHNSGVIGANTNNLIEDGSCDPAITGDPLLGPLQNNGGSTFTIALLSGSPAIDAGTNTGCPATDQRGLARPQDGDSNDTLVCDIGAFEAPPLPNLYLPFMIR